MPKNAELDELESLLVYAAENFCGELGVSAREALDVMRTLRAEIGPECTVRDLMHFLENVDGDATSKRCAKVRRPAKQILH